MRTLQRLALLLTLCVMTVLPVKAEPNGCGSGWNTALVPDKIGLLGCTMKNACDAHDTCYGLCEKRTDGECAYRRCRVGGDLAGKPACRVDAALLKSEGDAMTRRSVCDSKFAAAIMESNPERWACKAVAIIYREAVKKWGNPNFSGYGGWSEPAAWKQSQQDYEKAIALFVEKSTDTEFRQFVKSFDTDKPDVNFCARLRYSSTSGLENVDPKENKPCSPILKSRQE